MDLWKSIIQKVVADRVEDFKMSKDQETELKLEITKVLEALITEAESITQKPQTTVSGSLRKHFSKSFLKMTRDNVPRFSQTIIDELKKPPNSKKLKELVLAQFNVYAGLTQGNNADVESLHALLAKYGATSIADFNTSTEKEVRRLQVKAYRYTAVMLGSVVLLVLAWWSVRNRRDLHKTLFTGSAAFALVLLIASLSTPRIEIDARIKSVNLQLVGESVQFNDQVLYYRSKTLLQMVWILMRTGEADSVAVGVLLLMFSILFPATKLISTEIYLLGGEKSRKNKWIDFFGFKSGKWSMADVTVVAIFMAFIGFGGIVNNQIQNLNIETSSLESIATNATSLQPGFVLFTVFVLCGLALSEILKRITTGQGDVAGE